ncbi:hypothetical protein B0T14DRAFT_243641 [Immersiella caudata]|uniref:Secreted protein n=1 Tax=Immersiella caudata TaxID=314043 RepID=A0AA39WJ17_9PEZI|nr:hypothetical protein B0T14DRAFT_243641 [Immersiella caudata]
MARVKAMLTKRRISLLGCSFLCTVAGRTRSNGYPVPRAKELWAWGSLQHASCCSHSIALCVCGSSSLVCQWLARPVRLSNHDIPLPPIRCSETSPSPGPHLASLAVNMQPSRSGPGVWMCAGSHTWHLPSLHVLCCCLVLPADSFVGLVSHPWPWPETPSMRQPLLASLQRRLSKRPHHLGRVDGGAQLSLLARDRRLALCASDRRHRRQAISDTPTNSGGNDAWAWRSCSDQANGREGAKANRP